MSLSPTPYQRFMKIFKELSHSEWEIHEFVYGRHCGTDYHRMVCSTLGLTPPDPTNKCLCGVGIEDHVFVYRLRDQKCYLVGSTCMAN